MHDFEKVTGGTYWSATRVPTVLNELDDNLTNRRPDFQEFKKFIEKREPMTRFRVYKDRLGSTDRSIPTQLPKPNLRKLAHATGY